MAKTDNSEDIFFRKKFTFLIQYSLESKIFDCLRQRFNVETVMTKKGKLIIVEKKDREPVDVLKSIK